MGVLMEPAKENVAPSVAAPTSAAPASAASCANIDDFAMETRDAEFEKRLQPVPLIVSKRRPAAFVPFLGARAHPLNGTVNPVKNGRTTSSQRGCGEIRATREEHGTATVRPPPKKKWIKEYLEEEPLSPPVCVTLLARPPPPPPPPLPARTNGVVIPRASTPPVSVPAAPAAHVAPAAAPALHSFAALGLATTATQPIDFIFEHSRPRSNSHGPSIPSPSSSCSGTSTREAAGAGGAGGTTVVRAGTREVHNKLEKNRRAHLKECFELLKRQLPATNDDKKASNLSILGSANRYIQVLRRKERECEHEMERLAREKIAAQQRLAALKREVAARNNHAAPAAPAPRVSDVSPPEDRDRDERINGHLLGIPISITSTTSGGGGGGGGGAHSLNLSTLPVHLTTTSSQVQGVVRASYGARQLTLATLAPADPAHPPPHPPAALQNGQPGESGVSPALGTALVHPAHLHLPLSQVMRGGLVVGGGALQLVSGPAGSLRVLHTAPAAAHAPAPHLASNGGAPGREAARLPTENGVVCTSTSAAGATGVVVNGLAPVVVSQGQTHLLHTHSYKMLETQVASGPQYLSTAALVKPMMVVTGGAAAHRDPTSPVPRT